MPYHLCDAVSGAPSPKHGRKFCDHLQEVIGVILVAAYLQTNPPSSEKKKCARAQHQGRKIG